MGSVSEILVIVPLPALPLPQYKRSLVCYKEKQVLRQYLLEDMLPLPIDAPNSPFKTADSNPPLAAPNLMQVHHYDLG